MNESGPVYYTSIIWFTITKLFYININYCLFFFCKTLLDQSIVSVSSKCTIMLASWIFSNEVILNSLTINGIKYINTLLINPLTELILLINLKALSPVLLIIYKTDVCVIYVATVKQLVNTYDVSVVVSATLYSNILD